MRSGDHGRTGIKGETLVAIDVGSAARLVTGFEADVSKPMDCSRIAAARPPKPVPMTAALPRDSTAARSQLRAAFDAKSRREEGLRLTLDRRLFIASLQTKHQIREFGHFPRAANMSPEIGEAFAECHSNDLPAMTCAVRLTS